MKGVNLRTPEGGRVWRNRRLRFEFDGRDYMGHPGDTLASALIANGRHLVGRSFKYHRPRGIMTAGPEEPNALVQLRTGARTEPNQRATMVELYDGLVAESQNRWPSLEADFGAINARLSRLFPAGFYYKTFMWPKGAWENYESLIRRMAGLGKAPEEPDPDSYDKRYLHTDILVVGAGPAGLAAARAAAQAGARVVLADEQSEFGGTLLSAGAEIDGQDGGAWISDMADTLSAHDNVTLLPRTTAVGYYDHNFLTLLERVADHLARPDAGMPRQRLWKVRAKQVVLATGAIERPLVFFNNDLPGIMLAGAAESYVHRYGALPGRRVVVFTNNDTAYRAALRLHKAGVTIEAIVDARADGGGGMAGAAQQAGIKILSCDVVVRAHGGRRVEAVDVMRLDPSGVAVTGLPMRLECDCVLMSGGHSPSVHLFSQSGGRVRFDAAAAAMVPDEFSQPLQLAGALQGHGDLGRSLREGHQAGIAAAAAGGHTRTAGPAPASDMGDAPRPVRALWQVPAPDMRRAAAKQFVDFQNDVTAADLALATREGYQSIEHIKRYTTTGMGTDQGKTSNINALAIAAERLNKEIAAVGTTTFRPPYTPVSFGAIAGPDIGARLEPVRRTPLQGWHEDAGAVFEPVGQWMRPYYYPKTGEDMAAAVRRETKAARDSLGIMDASTLGKIDIRGPDAAEFLNRIYTNGWSKLGIDRCRYGLMLHEDGMVFDDGVTARLAEDHFHMTTTTGNAAAVLTWLESWRQTEWPSLKVYCTSVTEQWGVISITGPNARSVMEEVTEGIDLSNVAFPFMSLRYGQVAGIAARVFRISFTGELTYEINVPAGFTRTVWQALMTAGRKFGITPFGTEAMHVLRAEVGYIIVGQDTDGTVTPVDLGLEAMVSRAKDFIGKRSLSRSDTARRNRKQLVGLLPEDPSILLPDGAQIIENPTARPPVLMVGHVTSSYDSVNCGRTIALALLEGGGDRHGETVYAAYDGNRVAVKVTQPRFFDLEGARARG